MCEWEGYACMYGVECVGKKVCVERVWESVWGGCVRSSGTEEPPSVKTFHLLTLWWSGCVCVVGSTLVVC